MAARQRRQEAVEWCQGTPGKSKTSASQQTLQRTTYQAEFWLLKDRQTYRPDVQERTKACSIQPGERRI